MSFDETAEHIITMEGLIFALAVANVAGSDPSGSKMRDLRDARYLLKQAIVTALVEASHHAVLVEKSRQGKAE